MLNSPSELNAMVKSLQECMQYAVKRLASEEKTTEIRDLVLDQVHCYKLNFSINCQINSLLF